MSTLQEKVRELVLTRQDIAMLKAEQKRLEQAITDTKLGYELAQTKEAIKAMQGGEKLVYAEVCAKALQSYAETGDAKPHPAVTIKAMTTVVYEPSVAHDWASKHMNSLLSLDTRAFAKVAKVAELDFVKIGTEFKPTISRDLSKYA